MFGLLMLLFLVVPIVELYLFVEVSAAIGFGSALFWIVAVSIAGAWLVKREGMGALRRANQQMMRGEIPADEMVNGMLILLAGALMLTPGFLTDTVGLLLLFPPTRALARRPLRRRFRAGPIVIGGRFAPGSGAGGRSWTRSPDDVPGDVVDADSWEDPPERRELG